MALAVIEMREVFLKFGADLIFENISLKIEEGQSVAIVGPSGHGKTCLLKLMSGLLPYYKDN